MPHYRIAVVAGDGIGPEVMAEGLKILWQVAEPSRLSFAFEAPAEILVQVKACALNLLDIFTRHPRRVVFLDRLLLGGTGKLDRGALKRMAAEAGPIEATR